jgi:hypothetical protein
MPSDNIIVLGLALKIRINNFSSAAWEFLLNIVKCPRNDL